MREQRRVVLRDGEVAEDHRKDTEAVQREAALCSE